MRIAGLIVICAGCSGSAYDIEGDITITQGIYGRTLMTHDVGHHDPTPLVRIPVTAYRHVTRAYVHATQSDGDGVYQLQVPPDDYLLCVADAEPPTEEPLPDLGSCQVVVWSGGLIRLDWGASVTGGIWCRGVDCW